MATFAAAGESHGIRQRTHLTAGASMRLSKDGVPRQTRLLQPGEVVQCINRAPSGDVVVSQQQRLQASECGWAMLTCEACSMCLRFQTSKVMQVAHQQDVAGLLAGATAATDGARLLKCSTGIPAVCSRLCSICKASRTCCEHAACNMLT